MRPLTLLQNGGEDVSSMLRQQSCPSLSANRESCLFDYMGLIGWCFLLSARHFTIHSEQGKGFFLLDRLFFLNRRELFLPLTKQKLFRWKVRPMMKEFFLPESEFFLNIIDWLRR